MRPPLSHQLVGLPTRDGILAARTLFGHKGLVALDAVEVILHSREAAAQLLLASAAHKALAVVRLILVGDASGGDGLEGNSESD